MRIRYAKPSDAGALVRLRVEMFEALGVDARNGSWQRRCEVILARGLRDGSIVAVVAEDPDAPGGPIVASGAAVVSRRLPGPRDPGDLHAVIMSMVTEKPYRRRGLARRILTRLLEFLEHEGVGTVELHATRDGEELYRSLGFADVENPLLRRRSAAGSRAPRRG